MSRHLKNPEDSGKSNHTDEDQGLEVLLVSRYHQTDVEGENSSEVYPVDDGFPELFLVGTTGESG